MSYCPSRREPQVGVGVVQLKDEEIRKLKDRLAKLERVVEAADIFCKTKAEEHWTLNIVYKKLEDALRGVGEE